MANIVSNIVRLGGVTEDIEKVVSFVKSDDLLFDFRKIIPVPQNLESEHLWLIKNWGTACNTSDDFTEYDEDSFEFRFGTRWTAPIQIITKLAALFPNVSITYAYADEQFGNNCGYYEYANGVQTFCFLPDTYKEAQEIYDICW